MSDKFKMIFEDPKGYETIFFDEDGDLICESFTASEGGISCNVIDEEVQKILYFEIGERLGLSLCDKGIDEGKKEAIEDAVEACTVREKRLDRFDDAYYVEKCNPEDLLKYAKDNYGDNND